MDQSDLKTLFTNWEFWLSVSLLVGVGINLLGAWTFFTDPKKSARDLGMSWGSIDDSNLQGTKTLMRLAGVCLVALAVFYFVTALGPIQQVWSVVAATLARLSGVAFYAWNLTKFKGPAKFKFYLSVNTLLALSHGLLLACCPGGLEALRNDFGSFFWIRYLYSF